MKRLTLVAGACMALAACTSTHEMGVPPTLSPVGYGLGQGITTGLGSGGNDQPVIKSYPTPPEQPLKRFSLWDDGQSKLFTDARALDVGDILTVRIQIDDQARFRNESQRSRRSNRTLGLGGSFNWGGSGGSAGLEGDVDSDSESRGAGATVRSESIRLSVAAVVNDVLPNGNLIISGSQEVLVNAELRVLSIAGIVRPSDIDARNTVPYERIAEARISYGGRGRLAEVQQPPYGQQVLDAVLPF